MISDAILAFTYLAGLTGASVDERELCTGTPQCCSLTNGLLVKLITSFLLSYPLAGVLKRIPDAKPYQKNLFIIAYVNKLELALLV